MKELLTKKFMILMEVVGDYKNLNEIAEKVGVTKQAVSDYLKKMREEGLVDVVEGKYKVSIRGIEEIFTSIRKIEEWLNEKKKNLNMMESCVAIAGEDIRRGDRVGLFMKDGYLYAYKRESSARATAKTDAHGGEDVILTDFEGIIEFEFGKICLFLLPINSKEVDMDRIKKILNEKKGYRVGVMDVIGKVIADKLKIDYEEFFSIQSIINASIRGVSITLLGQSDELRKAISAIEEYNAKSIKKIKYEVYSFD